MSLSPHDFWPELVEARTLRLVDVPTTPRAPYERLHNAAAWVHGDALAWYSDRLQGDGVDSGRLLAYASPQLPDILGALSQCAVYAGRPDLADELDWLQLRAALVEEHELAGQVVVVTGSGALGAAVVGQLLEAGAVVVTRGGDAHRDLYRDRARVGAELHLHREGDLGALFRWARLTLGRVDVLVHLGDAPTSAVNEALAEVSEPVHVVVTLDRLDTLRLLPHHTAVGVMPGGPAGALAEVLVDACSRDARVAATRSPARFRVR